MNNVTDFFTNKYIWVPFFTWLGIQTFKVIWDLLTLKKFDFKRIIGAGRNAKFSFCSCNGSYFYDWK